MLTTLLWLVFRRVPAPYARAFVRAVTTREPIARHAGAEKLILAGWLAIAVKCLLVIWVVDRWAVPIHPYWINMPTIAMAALVTALYFWRDQG